MLTIWNRTQLRITYSMEEQARIRNILAEQRIDYRLKVVNRRNASPFGAGTRGMIGTLGENQDLSYEYIFYVKKEDMEKAIYAIR